MGKRAGTKAPAPVTSRAKRSARGRGGGADSAAASPSDLEALSVGASPSARPAAAGASVAAAAAAEGALQEGELEGLLGELLDSGAVSEQTGAGILIFDSACCRVSFPVLPDVIEALVDDYRAVSLCLPQPCCTRCRIVAGHSLLCCKIVPTAVPR